MERTGPTDRRLGTTVRRRVSSSCELYVLIEYSIKSVVLNGQFPRKLPNITFPIIIASNNRIQHKQGSVEQSSESNNLHSANTSELLCPKCNRFFVSPLMMPGCSHRVCKRCVRYLYQRSRDGYFHCPVAVCNQLCASAPDSLRTDRDLEEKVRQHLRAHPERRGSETRRISCQKSNCSAEVVGNEPCPHCQLRLCQEHFEEDCECINQYCKIRFDEGEKKLSELQNLIEKFNLEMRNIDILSEDNEIIYKQLIEFLENQFQARKNVLMKSRSNIESEALKLKDFYNRTCNQQEKMYNAMEVEDDDPKTLKKKLKLATESERLANSIQLPRLPGDIRFNFRLADIEDIKQKIKELTITQGSLEVNVTLKTTVPCSRDLTPHHAVLWSHTDEFRLDPRNIVQRRTQRLDANSRTLPDEVLIVNDKMNLHVLSLSGEFLEKIRVDDGTTPFIAKYLSVSPDGRKLVLLSNFKVLLCDMDGTLKIEIKLDSNEISRGLSDFCSVALSENHLMIVAPGNMRHRKPGAVFILEGPEFDFSRAKTIPLDNRRIFPIGVTQARDSFLVLANRLSINGGTEIAFNELLIYDTRSCNFVAEIPCSDEIHSGLNICSDNSGRYIVSVSRNRCDDQAGSSASQSADAEVIVLDPRGHQIGTIGADEHLNTCNGISVSHSRARTGRPDRLIVCDATKRSVHIYTLG